jgi:DNA-binding NarL/FixJ family response regulator
MSIWMVSLAERAYRLVVLARYMAISVFICGSGGRVARPWSRSATHSNWISAAGMTAPIGWTSPMKYSPASFGDAGAGLLGNREADVARLVADGLTNKQIGTRLFISERTVDSHVRSILNKLGFNSRAQIAAWMASPNPPA